MSRPILAVASPSFLCAAHHILCISRLVSSCIYGRIAGRHGGAPETLTGVTAWDLLRRYILQTYVRPNLVFTRGEGARLYDAHGKEYLDFAAGIAVNALGAHCFHHTRPVTHSNMMVPLGLPLRSVRTGHDRNMVGCTEKQ